VSDNNRRRVVLVTGAARGIGEGIAAAFAAGGDAVVVADRDAAGAETVARHLTASTGSETLGVAVDVRDATSIAAMVERATAQFGSIDVLVNNAGVYPNTPVLEMEESEWDDVFDTNVKGLFLVSKQVAATMVAAGHGGRIINLSSGASMSGRTGAAHYCASKAAVNMFTRVLAIELAPHLITVNAVAPGLIAVPNAPLAPAYVEAMLALTPVRKMGAPSDVANAVCFLAAPASSFITGEVLSVDGGVLAGRAVPLSRPDNGRA